MAANLYGSYNSVEILLYEDKAKQNLDDIANDNHDFFIHVMDIFPQSIKVARPNCNR